MNRRRCHPSDAAAVSVLLLCSIVAACVGTVTPIPTTRLQPIPRNLPTQAPAATPMPTATTAPTASPAAMPVLSSTPVRALDPAGPWLVGMTSQGPVAINPDGSGRTELFAGVTEGGPPEWLASEISSVGWVAAVMERTEDQPPTLVIGRPVTGVVRQIPILSPELHAEMDQLDENGQRKRWTEDVYLAFDDWLVTLAWSPDGQTLAFVAAVDGPSADLYVYDTVTDQVRRLTDGPNQPGLLGWSADGRWVLHLEIKDIHLGDGTRWDTLALWAAAADGSEVRKVPGIEQRLWLLNWASPTQFLVVHFEMGPRPPFNIELIDLYTGPVATLVPGYVYRWAIDPETSTISFVADPDVNLEEGGLEVGLYLASPSRPIPQVVGYAERDQEPYLGYTGEPVWSPVLNAFMVTTEEDRVALISTSGEIVRRIEGACSLPVPSPEGRWLAFTPCSQMAFGIEVRSEEDGSVLDLHLGSINDFFWSPDSSGIYYFQGERTEPQRLMFVSIPEGTPRLIHPDSGLRGGYWRPRFVEGP